MTEPISVFIIAKNEADRISAAIKSVIGWADEVLVIDSGSSDNTMQISESLGARAYFNEWKGYGAQKIFGESLCRNNWILNIDADEIISPRLKKSVLRAVSDSPNNHVAYNIDIALMLPYESKPRMLAVSTRAIRLYNKKYAGFRNSTVHDSVVVNSGTVGNLRGVMHHRSFRGYAHEVGKINHYSTMQAEDWVRRGKPAPAIWRILCEPFTAFLKAYIIRRYFLYGVEGVIQSCVYSFSKTLRLAKVRELLRGRPSAD